MGMRVGPRARRLAGGLLAALLLAAPGGPTAGEAPEPRRVLTWGTKGDGPGEFHSPIGIAVGPRDEVFVTDVNNARVQRFTSEGRHLGGFDLPRDSPERRSCQAGGIAVDGEGLVYLSLMMQHRVAVYTAAGALVREWGRRGAGDGEFQQPGGLLLGPDGTLLVADQCNHRVQRFTLRGEFLGRWGGHGEGPGQYGAPEPAGSRFGGPHFLARDSRGRLYTTEGARGRVQQLSPAGEPLAQWGDKGDQPGGFGGQRLGASRNTYGPIGVMVDPRDRVWVSSLNDRVQAFTPEGKLLLVLGGPGTGPGQFARPHGMAMDSRGFLYVCDAGNQRIQKFALPAR